MAMPRSVRAQLLTDEWKVTRPEMDNAIRDANRIKQNRRRTVNNLDTPLEKASYQVEKAKRNTGRVLRSPFAKQAPRDGLSVAAPPCPAKPS